MPPQRVRARGWRERTGVERYSCVGQRPGVERYSCVGHPLGVADQKTLNHQVPASISERFHFHAPTRSGTCSPIGLGFSTAAYPLCARCLSAAGHITTNPPSAINAPPSQTHRTRGLNVTRISAPSAPRTPASTTYTSCLNDPMVPTSVDGSNVGAPP